MPNPNNISNKNKSKSSMRTRQKDKYGRGTANSEGRTIVDDGESMKKKYQHDKSKKIERTEIINIGNDKNNLDKNIEEKIKQIIKEHSINGTSGIHNESNINNNNDNDNDRKGNDKQFEIKIKQLMRNSSGSGTSESNDESENYTDNDEEEPNTDEDENSSNKIRKTGTKKGKEKKRISDSDETSINSNTRKKNKKESFFNSKMKSKIYYYVRNDLFPKIKILGNEHLETDGIIIQQALKKVNYDAETHNIHAYVQECRKLLRQTMCARRGYVKRKIGSLLRGMNLYAKTKQEEIF